MSSSPRRSSARTPDTPGTRRLSRRGRSDRGGYWVLSMRPLHVLAFLTPLIVLYEIGARLTLGDAAGGIQTVRAHDRLARALDILGVAGAFLPWVVLVTILVVWHVMSRDRWRIQFGVLLGMVGESVVGALPLLVLAALLFGRDGSAPLAAVSLGDLPWTARAVLSIGAGLYEELVFRMLLLAAIHLVLADFARVPSTIAGIVAIVVSSVAFALYHDAGSDGGAIARSVFYVLAGVYFGLIAVVRGFGVVVGVHVVYDLVVLVLLRPV